MSGSWRKTGCGWRELPHDFPKWKTVYHYFRQYRLYGPWEEMNEQIHKAVRGKEGRAVEPTAMIIDCQSMKSAEGGEAIGFDGGKKVHGRKRVLLTDTQGFVRLAKVVAADVHDSMERISPGDPLYLTSNPVGQAALCVGVYHN